MQLTPIPPEQLAPALATFAAGVAGDAAASAAITHIRASVGAAGDEPRLTRDAIGLCHRLGIPTLDEAPADAFSWDGAVLRTRSEACVLFHEVAHWQLATPERRLLPDFGLGAGPETGRFEEADAARVLTDDELIFEEGCASLLGILWETAAGGPAIESFLEQNWLERYEQPGTHRLFADTIAALVARGLLGMDGRPA